MLDHLEQAQRAREDAGRIVRLELDAQLRQQLGQRVVELDGDGTDAFGVHQLFTSPRAKIDATKLSTSVADTSSYPKFLIRRCLTTSIFACVSRSTTFDTSDVSLIESFWSSNSFASSALCRRSFVL